MNRKPEYIKKTLCHLHPDRVGNRVKTVERVMVLAKQRKAIIYRGVRITAAFVASMQAHFLFQEIQHGLIREYKPKPKETQ